MQHGDPSDSALSFSDFFFPDPGTSLSIQSAPKEQASPHVILVIRLPSRFRVFSRNNHRLDDVGFISCPSKLAKWEPCLSSSLCLLFHGPLFFSQVGEPSPSRRPERLIGRFSRSSLLLRSLRPSFPWWVTPIDGLLSEVPLGGFLSCPLRHFSLSSISPFF